MRRFAIYRGVAGYLVAHPSAGSTKLGSAADGGPSRTGRYAGMRKLSNQDILKLHGVKRPGSDGKRMPRLDELELVDRYEPREELFDITTVDARRTLEKAADRGQLERVGEMFEASDMRAAMKRMKSSTKSSSTKTKSTKGGE